MLDAVEGRDAQMRHRSSSMRPTWQRTAARVASRSQQRGATSGVVRRKCCKQVRLIELRTRGLVNSLFSGEYRSVFKGQGMEFAEVREYQPGDEVRSIDWNVTARMRRPFVKRYIEERELTVMLAVDVSGSERFGTRAPLQERAGAPSWRRCSRCPRCATTIVSA